MNNVKGNMIDDLLIHIKGECQVCDSDNLTAVSNNDGVIAYFTSEETANNFLKVVRITSRRIESLIESDINQETYLNELETILNEIAKLTQICK